ncbi:hypothetical protein Tco_0034249, partial [Tanacetum coccineum]
QEVAAPRAVVLADSPVSTSIDQDASSSSTPSTQEQEQSLNISQESTSQGSSSNVRQTDTPFEHLGRWTKDHPMANLIDNPSLSVSTRKQLQTDAMWFYFDAFLTSALIMWVAKILDEVHLEVCNYWETGTMISVQPKKEKSAQYDIQYRS